MEVTYFFFFQSYIYMLIQFNLGEKGMFFDLAPNKTFKENFNKQLEAL